MTLERLQNRFGRQPLVNEKRQRGHVKRGALGLARPVEEGLREAFEFGRRGFEFGEQALLFNASGHGIGLAFRRRLRGPRQCIGDVGNLRNQRFAAFARWVLAIPRQLRRQRIVKAIFGRRTLELALRRSIVLHPDLGPDDGLGFGVFVAAGLGGCRFGRRLGFFGGHERIG